MGPGLSLTRDTQDLVLALVLWSWKFLSLSWTLKKGHPSRRSTVRRRWLCVFCRVFFYQSFFSPLMQFLPFPFRRMLGTDVAVGTWEFCQRCMEKMSCVQVLVLMSKRSRSWSWPHEKSAQPCLGHLPSFITADYILTTAKL